MYSPYYNSKQNTRKAIIYHELCVLGRPINLFWSNLTTADKDEFWTKMLNDQDLPSLQDRMKAARLTFSYKVVEGLTPSCQQYLQMLPLIRKRPNSCKK